MTRLRQQPKFSFIAPVFLSTALVGCVAAASPKAALGLAALALYVAVTLLSPRTAMLAWIVSLCFIPAWFGVFAGGTYWDSAGIISLATLPAIFVHRRAQVFGRADAIPIALAASCLAVVILGLSPQKAGLDLVLLGVIPYAIARVLAPLAGFEWVYRSFSLVMAAFAVWAILELALDFHPLVGLFPESPTAFWSEIRYRGGAVRSEATFGHAIALGGVLAMAIPLTLGSQFSTRTKVSLLAIFVLGILATASRGPLAAAFLGALLMVVTRHDGRRIRGRGAVLVVIGILAVVFSITLASSLGDSEAVNSATYRSDLYDALLPTLNPLGLADSFSIDVSGASNAQGFVSIDSTYLQIGLIFGAIPLLIAFVGLALNLVRVLIGRSSPAGVALAAQVPLFASVWLIAQYYPMVWFLVGLTVAAEQTRLK